jgi:hypothetical protein
MKTFNNITGTSVGADLLCPPPIYRPSTDIPNIPSTICSVTLLRPPGEPNSIL